MPVPPEGEVLRRSTNATEAQWDAAVRGLKEICRMGKRQDIIFSMETTVGFADSSESLLRLFDQVQAENLGANLQVPLMGDLEKGMSEMDSVEKLGKHVVHVHANNSADKEKQWPHCFLDEGYLDYDAILGRLHDFGFKGYVSVEHGNWGGKDPLEIAQHEIIYLKRLIENLTL